METNYFILSFVLIPLLAFAATLFVAEKREFTLANISYYSVLLHLLVVTFFIGFWLYRGAPYINIREITIYDSPDYTFLIDFCFDRNTAFFLWIGSFISLLIVRYCSYYLHMEAGYKRFFNTVLFFFLAYNLTILAGNFETLFIGWEMLGISSFLLISFYRERYLPVRNALKVFSIYRIGDVGILLAAWASHHLWHENITFFKLNNYHLVHDHLLSHSGIGIFISICLLIAATAKSAQFPFSSWLPRAMEGPTPSSAIFYGSLSVHLGVYLLLRMEHFWEHQPLVRVLIGLIGFTTAVLSYFVARVQSNIKTQIAYASLTQIGLMFIELSLGWTTLVLIHFAGNAFLRTYQLLVSPSTVSYLIREQFYHFTPHRFRFYKGISHKLQNTLYLLALKEWNLDQIINSLLFKPIRKLGHKLDFLTPANLLLYVLPAYLVAMIFLWQREWIPAAVRPAVPALIAFVGLVMVFKAFSERKYPRVAWSLVMLNHFWTALAVSFNEDFDMMHTAFYLSGVIVSGLVGLVCLQILKQREPAFFDLENYYGHIYEYPKMGFVFLLATLGMIGFPITLTFIGEDLLLSHVHENQYLLAFFIALSFVMDCVALLRLYSRLFMGPHVKRYHATPLRSA
ncbi:proton-conducting transporter transmembrane domain-containing protein [Rhodoflexus sp.]